uniref:Uncharacterized protein n=1 Tax=Romanomermis culicivorax TaxID=13658 RepID=A0A915JSA9_ROMCU
MSSLVIKVSYFELPCFNKRQYFSRKKYGCPYNHRLAIGLANPGEESPARHMAEDFQEGFLLHFPQLRNKEYEEKCRECMDLDQKLTEAGQTYEKNQAEINETKVAIERLSRENSERIAQLQEELAKLQQQLQNCKEVFKKWQLFNK